jgi:hypothetical protein
MTNNKKLSNLLEALQNIACFDHPVKKFCLIETHISYILLTGDFAYKFKKPVNLGFLDFSTLEKRKYYLDQEYRLNRRLAPELYLEVIPVTGTESKPGFAVKGEPVIEYALKMVQFPVEDQLDVLLDKDNLLPEHMDDLAKLLAGFHASLAPATEDSIFGKIVQTSYPVIENFERIKVNACEKELYLSLLNLKHWSEDQLKNLELVFKDRKQQGFIRECHGDMHLSNIVLIDGKVVIFDCIEFNESFRWIDVISELAFTLMDLEFRQRKDLANRLLNTYLERIGDYGGLSVLTFYLIYRSMVRAKVADIQRRQTQDDALRKELSQRLFDHVRLAESYMLGKKSSRLLITHGFSGSGKTTYTTQLVDYSGAIRIRSDVERKRLYDLEAETRAGTSVGQDLYQTSITKQTYTRLMKLTQTIIQSGFIVIVDATFLQSQYRKQFKQLASKLSVPFKILDFQAPINILETRIITRQKMAVDASDADLNVLKHQLTNHDQLDKDEQPFIVEINTEKDFDPSRIIDAIEKR